MAELRGMVLMVLVAAVLTALAVYVVLRGSARILEALGIDLLGAMLYLGLAERPLQPREVRKRRLRELLPEPPPTAA